MKFVVGALSVLFVFHNLEWSLAANDGLEPAGLRGTTQTAANEGEQDTKGEATRFLQPTCGNGNIGNGICANGLCCSQYGWCGTSAAHCGGGTCGGGNIGDGVCSNGECCSEYGWCGTSDAHCGGGGSGGSGGGGCNAIPQSQLPSGSWATTDEKCEPCAKGQSWWPCNTNPPLCDCMNNGGLGSGPTPAPAGSGPTPAPTGNGGSFSINSPPKILTISDLQAGLDAYPYASVQANQARVDQINSVTTSGTGGWTLYRQLAFVAQTIWESVAYQYTEEIAAVTPPYSNKWNYQDCDWNVPGTQLPANGKPFYGRGYIQLSWCANYKLYGANRMIQGDPDYFYKNPELVATTYAMDSAAWFFEEMVPDTSGNFGATTNAINGALECNGGSTAPALRYKIFDAIAQEVGLTGYSPNGC